MNHFFAGLRHTVLTLLIVGLSLITAHYFQTDLLIHVTSIELFNRILVVGCILFAAQFNHSRISLLCVWIAVTDVYTFTDWWGGLTWPEHGQLLSSYGVLALLSVVKDRGLKSIHGVFRLVATGLILMGSWVWLTYQSEWLGWLALWSIPYLSLVEPYLVVQLPLASMAMLLLWQSVRYPCWTRAALLSVGILWYWHAEQAVIHQQLLVACIVIHCWMVVVIDSYGLAYRDELTGLPSRRALNQLGLSLGNRYTVAMMDIDHFKQFNDTYGHDVGDQVLQWVGTQLTKLRGGGRVFRYGGEEFTLVFPRKKLEQTLERLETLRHSIAEHDLLIPVTSGNNKGKKPQRQTKTVRVTISIGVAERQAKLNFEQTLKQADQALYRAKHSGRNTVSQ